MRGGLHTRGRALEREREKCRKFKVSYHWRVTWALWTHTSTRMLRVDRCKWSERICLFSKQAKSKRWQWRRCRQHMYHRVSPKRTCTYEATDDCYRSLTSIAYDHRRRHSPHFETEPANPMHDNNIINARRYLRTHPVIPHARQPDACVTHNKCERSTTKDKSRNKIVAVYAPSISSSVSPSLSPLALMHDDIAFCGSQSQAHWALCRGWQDFHMSFILLMDLRLLLNCFSFSLE